MVINIRRIFYKNMQTYFQKFITKEYGKLQKLINPYAK